MIKKPVYSIVMPVYNAAEYLDAAVAAVRAQTFENWELILVDDGSTDGSGEMCGALAKRDARIRVIRQKNAGASQARNAGMEEVRGEYMIFLDADDEVETSLLQQIFDAPKADVVVWGMWDEYLDAQGQCFKRVAHVPRADVYVGAQAVRRALIDLEQETLLGYLWNKCYRVDQVRQSSVRFENRLLTEDIFFNLRLCGEWESLCAIDLPAVHYRHRQTHESITSRFVPDYFQQSRERVDAILTLYDGWRMADAHVLTTLGNIYARYTFSAVERLFDLRANTDAKARRAFMKARFEDDVLFARLIDHAAPTGIISRMMAMALRTRNVTLCLLIGWCVHLARVKLPGLFTHLRQSR